MELEDILRESFPSLSGRPLALMAESCRLVECPRNSVLFLEGDAGSAFFQLIEGTIKIFKTSPSGQETVLKLLEPGAFFGEVVLIEQGSYPVSAVAIQDSRVLRIPCGPFMKLLDEPEFRTRFIAMLMAKQRYLTERILYLTGYDVEERFFRFLIDRWGIRSSYEPDLSKKDIASAIGTIPETLSRLLDRLKRRNIISWRGRVLTVQKDYLEQFFAEGEDRQDQEFS
ncbi:MAG: Crp/Fnr family transcriptional regulator [Desulfomonilia bacterium]|jgi:CRP-like cAMP-binding protein